MKAVFIHQATLLRDSHIDSVTPGDGWQLMPATIEAVRLLANDETLVLLYCVRSDQPQHHGEEQTVPEELLRTARQLEAGGGRVDGVIGCGRNQTADEPDGTPYPGLVWSAVARFSLRPEQCYLLGDTLQDVNTAAAAGVRPVVILGDRTIEQVFGRADLDKDFPMTTDLVTAVQYIQVEEEITRQTGQPRSEPVPVPSDLLLPANLERLASVTVLSPLARDLAEKTGRTRVQRTDIARWLFLLSFGALGLSLGIAYLLTHLYRVQPFPEFVYYLTLQFIPRALRGVLFILIGLVVIAVAVKSILRSAAIRDWLNGARRYVR
jgi:histidinol phosphatase-like enzyme